jgi:Outer membrane protein beta-barrel domain
MKKLMLLLLLFSALYSYSQVGFRAGVNFANVTKSSSFNNSSRSGFHVGVMLAPPSKKIMSSRTELIFSRQGYDYKSGTNTGNVNLDYIMMPQLMSINITKYFSILVGGHMAFLLNAKVDSSNASTGNSSVDKIMDLYNRFDYGYGGGVEIHPVSGLLIGARVNISLGNLYNLDYSSGNPPSFIPKIDVKNNVFQVYAGWKFGGKKDKKGKKDE